jgi:RNA polymerase sigma factor (sigma-70 family)
MAGSSRGSGRRGTFGARFPSTQWSVVLAAGGRKSSDARRALEALFEVYWYPLYAYVRRRGHGFHEASELTQGFIARLLERRTIEVADRERGRFRSFLIASLKNFLANEWDRARAKKRGGGVNVLSLDLPIDIETAERRYSLEPVHGMTPEKVFERRWALTLIERVTERLRAEARKATKVKLFDALSPYVVGEGPVGSTTRSGRRGGAESYAAVARSLEMTEGAVKTAIHRLRKRFRSALRDEIADTVSDPEDIDDEIRYLIEVIGS